MPSSTTGVVAHFCRVSVIFFGSGLYINSWRQYSKMSDRSRSGAGVVGIIIKYMYVHTSIASYCRTLLLYTSSSLREDVLGKARCINGTQSKLKKKKNPDVKTQ